MGAGSIRQTSARPGRTYNQRRDPDLQDSCTLSHPAPGTSHKLLMKWDIISAPHFVSFSFLRTMTAKGRQRSSSPWPYSTATFQRGSQGGWRPTQPTGAFLADGKRLLERNRQLYFLKGKLHCGGAPYPRGGPLEM